MPLEGHGGGEELTRPVELDVEIDSDAVAVEDDGGADLHAVAAAIVLSLVEMKVMCLPRCLPIAAAEKPTFERIVAS